MSMPVAVGEALLRATTPFDSFGAATTRETALDSVALGFWICTETFPATETSAAVTGAVHAVAVMHVVVRAVPAMSRVEPGPGLEIANPLPSTSNVKPSAAPT